MVNIAKCANKVFSHVDPNSVAKYAKKMPELNVDTQRILKTAKVHNVDKFEKANRELNAIKKEFSLADLPLVEAKKAPLWKRALGKIFG